jgi:hypothetical protein
MSEFERLSIKKQKAIAKVAQGIFKATAKFIKTAYDKGTIKTVPEAITVLEALGTIFQPDIMCNLLQQDALEKEFETLLDNKDVKRP